MRIGLIALCMIACLCLSACRSISDGKTGASPVVGAWLVKIPEAPFPYHMFVFHSDGTIEQSNPDAGDPNTSDSNLMGAWVPDRGGYRGKLVEVTADRATHHFVSRGEISFSIRVNDDAFAGTANAVFYDADGRQIGGSVAATLSGQRVVP